MQNIRHINPQKFWPAGLILIGAAIIISIVLFSSTALVEHLHPNGVFADGMLDKLTIVKIFRGGVFLLGAILIFFGILKVSGRDSSHGKERVSENRHVLFMKQPRTIVVIIFSLLAIILLNKAVKFSFSDNWKSVIGYEYYWIAESMAGGHGYSLPANHRWYYYDFKSEYPDDQFFPTALEEPVYPFLLAFAFKYLGEYGRLAVLLFNVAALYLTSILIYLLVRKIYDSHFGIIASIALITWWWFDISWITLGVFSPAIIGGLNIIFSAYLIIWSLEKISVTRGIVLGIMLAFSCLTLSAGLLFLPLAVLLTIILKRPLTPLAWKPALAIVVTVGVILFPWMLRNYIVFHHVIPVRTGFGLALHQSNPALAATFSANTHARDNELEPIWRAKNAKDAIDQVRSVSAKRMAMYKRSYDYIESEAPANYSAYNEAERDKVYLGKSYDFIKSNPKTFVSMTRYRIQAFLVGWNSRQTLVSLLAIVGALIAWRNQKVLILVLLVGAYTFTFSIATSLMYRYRYPIEPIFFTLSCGIPIIALSNIKVWIAKIKSQMTSQLTLDQKTET